MNKILFTLALLFILLMITSCKDTTSVSYDETRITTILYNIKQAFNSHDIDALMTGFHQDYLHNGNSRFAIREIWLNRMGEYLLINFENVKIRVADDKAVVSFTMKLIKQDATLTTEEPGNSGDLSYFFYDGYDWYVYGNQVR